MTHSYLADVLDEDASRFVLERVIAVQPTLDNLSQGHLLLLILGLLFLLWLSLVCWLGIQMFSERVLEAFIDLSQFEQAQAQVEEHLW